MTESIAPAWWHHGTCDEWLEAAQAAVLDQRATSGQVLSLALIALTEAVHDLIDHEAPADV